MHSLINPDDFIITKKRKKYKFALFHNNSLCFEFEDWDVSWRADILEIGAGTALFSVALAERYPEKRIVAVDVKADRLQTGAQLAEEKGLTNIRFLRARADQLPTTLPAGTINTIWITFPDPFPKDRYAKHRLTHPRFLSIYHDLLAPTGRLRFKTDAHALFDWSLEQLVAQNWIIDELVFDLHSSPLSDEYKVMTTYETRFNQEGLPTYFVQARYNG